MFKGDNGMSSRDSVTCAIKLCEGNIQSSGEELMSLRSSEFHYEKAPESVKLDLGQKTIV